MLFRDSIELVERAFSGSASYETPKFHGLHIGVIYP